jgi:hypothetical protein
MLCCDASNSFPTRSVYNRAIVGLFRGEVMFPLDPKLAKDLAEERQRELLEDAEAEHLADGDIPADEYPSDNYKPVTDSEDDLVSTRKSNRHVRGDNQ